MIIKLYKLYINAGSIIRGTIKSLLYSTFWKNIKIENKLRVKSNTEWKLFPGCRMFIGKRTIIGKDVTINVSNNAMLNIGSNVGIGNRCQIVAHRHISIGIGTILAPNVMVYDHNHVFDKDNGVQQRNFIDGEVIIGEHCWIGTGCVILKDVHIGDNCVIGAGSVVTKDIPSCSIAVGIPAKVVKKID